LQILKTDTLHHDLR